MINKRLLYLLFVVVALFVGSSCQPQSTPSPEALGTPAPAPTSEPSMPSPTEESSTPAVIEGMFDVGGLELYLRCEGKGSPTIIYLHGSIEDENFSGASSGRYMQSQMGDRYRFCVYDRRNVGKSGEVEGYFTGATAVEDLHALLASVEVEPPYVLLGASFGGLIGQLYSGTYPGEVVGMVLLDSPVPAELDLEVLLPEDMRFNHEEDREHNEKLDHFAVYEEAYAVERPAIPVVYLLAMPSGWPTMDVPEWDAAILDTIRDYIEGFSPGIVVEVQSPHYMELAVPKEIMAELERVIALANGETAPVAHPFTGESAWIAYQTNRGGSDGVWLVRPDGTDDHQIATAIPEPVVKLPDWSPDGTRLLVATQGGDTGEPLYEYDLATNTFTELLPCPTDEPCWYFFDDPAYSPDGKQVVFIRYLAPFVYSEALGGEVPSDCGLWIADIATGELTQITSNTDPPCDREYFPHWSSDGTQLVYTRDPYDKGQSTGTMVCIINADGSDERCLTDPQDNAGEADWSPDGDWIVFATYPLFEYDRSSPETSNLYRMHPDGTGMEQLTFNETPAMRATQPRYTPDGKWILFTAVTPSSRSIWAIPADGGEPIVITTGGIYTHPTWQPSGN